MNRASKNGKNMSISGPLPPIVTRLPKPASRTVKTLLPTSRSSSIPAPAPSSSQRPGLARRVSKSSISRPIPIRDSIPGFGSNWGARRPSTLEAREGSSIPRTHHDKPSATQKLASSLVPPFVSRSLAKEPPAQSYPCSSTLSRVTATRIPAEPPTPGLARPTSQIDRSAAVHPATPLLLPSPTPLPPHLGLCLIRAVQQATHDAPLANIHRTYEGALDDYEDLMSVQLSLDSTLPDTPPYTPLIGPRPPVTGLSHTHDNLMQERLNLASCLCSSIIDDGADLCESPGSISSIVWRYLPMSVNEKPKPILSIDTSAATSVRDEITRGIVSAVDHMLDDDELMFPLSAVSPIYNRPAQSLTSASDGEHLPAIHRLRIPGVSRAKTLLIAASQVTRDLSLHMPEVHKDVWAAYWALHQTRVEPDVDDYFTHMTSPV
jgi:hypothetical protein